MNSRCYSCKEIFESGSLKTSRSRFKLMGITPPEGMSISDRICNKCLQKMYHTQIKQARIKQFKKNMKKDLLQHRNRDLNTIRKKI